MLKLEFKEATAVLLVLAALSVGIALLGINPLAAPDVLSISVRFGFFGLSVGLFCLAVVLNRRSAGSSEIKPTGEYLERFKSAQEGMATLVPDNRVLGEALVGRSTFIAINGDILEARTDVLVSSDDNHFTAKGGVATKILKKAGPAVEAELENLRGLRFRQGQIAITSGGAWKCRAIIHAALIDLDENRYPNEQVVRLLVRRCLTCAVAIGARSAAFPYSAGERPPNGWIQPRASERSRRRCWISLGRRPPMATHSSTWRYTSITLMTRPACLRR